MVRLTINGMVVEVVSSSTIMQVADAHGFEIPRFCYHPSLAIAGNCRICVVEVLGFPKPVAACATPVTNNMVILTSTPQTMKVRESVMELILFNHPLDCPVCEQGGECDLQDQAMKYGSPLSRNLSGKRGVSDKRLSPLMSAVMTRCINCTRCVRYANDHLADQHLGITGRGGHAEIGTYDGSYLSTYMTGEIVDLCPVGALTTRLPGHDVKLRNWDSSLSSFNDPLDPFLSPIHLKEVGGTFRAIPIDSPLSDKSRYAWADLYSELSEDHSLQTTIAHPLLGFLISSEIDLTSRSLTAYFDSYLQNDGSYSLHTHDTSLPFYVLPTLSSLSSTEDHSLPLLHTSSLSLSFLNGNIPVAESVLVSPLPLPVPFPQGMALPEVGSVSESHLGHARIYDGHTIDTSYGVPGVPSEHYSGYIMEGSLDQSWSSIPQSFLRSSLQHSIQGIPLPVSPHPLSLSLTHIMTGSSTPYSLTQLVAEYSSTVLSHLNRPVSHDFWSEGPSLVRSSSLMKVLSRERLTSSVDL